MLLAVEADNELGDKTDKDHERISLNSVMPILSIQTEPNQRHGDSDLMQKLLEKEREVLEVSSHAALVTR